MSANPHSELREETLRRLAEHQREVLDVAAYRMLTDTNTDPWPPVWTHNNGRTWEEYLTQSAERFDACRDQDGKLFPFMPHQVHRQKASK